MKARELLRRLNWNTGAGLRRAIQDAFKRDGSHFFIGYFKAERTLMKKDGIFRLADYLDGWRAAK